MIETTPNKSLTDMTNFEKVSQWLKENYDVDVKLGQMTCFLGHGAKRIFIHHNFNLEKNGLIALLHEAGHVTQPEGKVGPNRYKSICDIEKPKKFKMLRFMNEVDAWDKALEIAEELGIELDMKRWNEQKDEALETYYV